MKKTSFVLLLALIYLTGCLGRSSDPSGVTRKDVEYLQHLIDVSHISHEVSDESPVIYMGDNAFGHLFFKLRVYPFKGHTIERFYIPIVELQIPEPFGTDYKESVDFDSYYLEHSSDQSYAKWKIIVNTVPAVASIKPYELP